MSQFFNDNPLFQEKQARSDQEAADNFYREALKSHDESLRLLAEVIDQNESSQKAISDRLTMVKRMTNIYLAVTLLGFAIVSWLHFGQ